MQIAAAKIDSVAAYLPRPSMSAGPAQSLQHDRGYFLATELSRRTYAGGCAANNRYVVIADHLNLSHADLARREMTERNVIREDLGEICPAEAFAGRDVGGARTDMGEETSVSTCFTPAARLEGPMQKRTATAGSSSALAD
jgi:hypothetical protein